MCYNNLLTTKTNKHKIKDQRYKKINMLKPWGFTPNPDKLSWSGNFLRKSAWSEFLLRKNDFVALFLRVL